MSDRDEIQSELVSLMEGFGQRRQEELRRRPIRAAQSGSHVVVHTNDLVPV